jgi:hypothetical protein
VKEMAITFKSFDLGVIASGNYAETEWTPDKDITIRAVVLVEVDDKSLSNTKGYISIADVPYTKDFVPGSVIGQDLEYCWKPNLALAKGAKFYFKLTNSRADSIHPILTVLYE